jgi:hypothetical protein
MPDIPLPPDATTPDGTPIPDETLRALLILVGPTGDPLAVGAVPVDVMLLPLPVDPLGPRR